MTQTRPYKAILDIERRWQQRPSGAILPVDKSRRRGTLSSLQRPGDMASHCRGKGIIHPHWLCYSCGHE